MCLYLKSKWGGRRRKNCSRGWDGPVKKTKTGWVTEDKREKLNGEWHWESVSSYKMLQWMMRCAAKSSSERTHSPSCWKGWLSWPSAKSFPTNDLLLKRAPHPSFPPSPDTAQAQQPTHVGIERLRPLPQSTPLQWHRLGRNPGETPEILVETAGKLHSPFCLIHCLHSLTGVVSESTPRKIPSHSLFPRNLTQDRCAAYS